METKRQKVTKWQRIEMTRRKGRLFFYSPLFFHRLYSESDRNPLECSLLQTVRGQSGTIGNPLETKRNYYVDPRLCGKT